MSEKSFFFKGAVTEAIDLIVDMIADRVVAKLEAKRLIASRPTDPAPAIDECCHGTAGCAGQGEKHWCTEENKGTRG